MLEFGASVLRSRALPDLKCPLRNAKDRLKLFEEKIVIVGDGAFQEAHVRPEL